MNNGYIRVEHLTKRYGDLVVLNDISLDVAEGEFVALLGPSGCGKTTLLRAIAGFVEFRDGDILIDGRSMKHLPPNRRPVNTVFQNYALFPHLTVAQNVGFGRRRAGKAAGETASIVAECLSTVGMAAYGDRFPSQLSGGQQQRVAIARALALSPKLMLFDEPTSALDPELVSGVLDTIRSLAERGMTLIVVSHEMNFARKLANTIHFVCEGIVMESGAPEEIFGRPKSERLTNFIRTVSSH